MDRGGLEPLTASVAQFRAALACENHTLKRSLTDPRLFSGIGNAYSDEILHAARLSPLKLTRRSTDDEIDAPVRGHTRHVERLDRPPAGRGRGRVPGKGDRVSRRHGRAWPVRQAVPGLRRAGPAHRLRGQRVQLLRACQTGGRLLADRSLSRLLEGRLARTLDDW